MITDLIKLTIAERFLANIRTPLSRGLRMVLYSNFEVVRTYSHPLEVKDCAGYTVLTFPPGAEFWNDDGEMDVIMQNGTIPFFVKEWHYI